MDQFMDDDYDIEDLAGKLDYITLVKSHNKWGTMKTDSKFFQNVQFGEQIGVLEIFKDYEID